MKNGAEGQKEQEELHKTVNELYESLFENTKTANFEVVQSYFDKCNQANRVRTLSSSQIVPTLAHAIKQKALDLDPTLKNILEREDESHPMLKSNSRPIEKVSDERFAYLLQLLCIIKSYLPDEVDTKLSQPTIFSGEAWRKTIATFATKTTYPELLLLLGCLSTTNPPKEVITSLDRALCTIPTLTENLIRMHVEWVIKCLKSNCERMWRQAKIALTYALASSNPNILLLCFELGKLMALMSENSNDWEILYMVLKRPIDISNKEIISSYLELVTILYYLHSSELVEVIITYFFKTIP